MSIEKTVFISYRRTNIYHARAVYQFLTGRGYDVFLDYQSIDSGAFDRIILNQIAARAHFLIILTPSALERCADPTDWLRREIEHAMDLERNIVPLMFDPFRFEDAQKHLVGKLAQLPHYNGLHVPDDFFDEAMNRLVTRYLNVALDTVLHPTPPEDRAEVARRQTEAAATPKPEPEQLTAEQYFERGYAADERGEYQQAIAAYSEVIRLKPDDAVVYTNRGAAHWHMGDLETAIADYDAALRLKPDYAIAYHNRGLARQNMGDLEAAIADYDVALRLKPDYADAYFSRGFARRNMGDLEGAIADYGAARRLRPDDAGIYNNRGFARHKQGDLEGAIADYEAALRIDPNHAHAKPNLEIVRREKAEQDRGQ